MIASLFALVFGAQTPASAPVTAPPAAKPVCTAPGPVPAGLSGWGTGAPVTAAANVQGVGEAMLPIGRGVVATLRPAGAVALPAALTKPAAAGSHAGVFAFSAAEPGRYRVALGVGAWVDVVANGAALPSVAHGHGPDCSPVRKTVDFDLKPGRYLLQVAGSTAPSVSLMIAKAG